MGAAQFFHKKRAEERNRKSGGKTEENFTSSIQTTARSVRGDHFRILKLSQCIGGTDS